MDKQIISIILIIILNLIIQVPMTHLFKNKYTWYVAFFVGIIIGLLVTIFMNIVID